MVTKVENVEIFALYDIFRHFLFTPFETFLHMLSLLTLYGNFFFWHFLNKKLSPPFSFVGALVGRRRRRPNPLFSEKLANHSRPLKKNACPGTTQNNTKQHTTTHGHCDLETELAQWADSLKMTKFSLFFCLI